MASQILNLIVKNVTHETPDVVILDLVEETGAALPLYQPGAHIELTLPSGLRRQYSLCQLATTGLSYRIAVLKDPHSRGGSKELHGMKIGDRIQSGRPQNHFLLKNPRKPVLLLAAGIGVTPLIPMAQMLQQFGTDFSFVYAAKSPRKAAFYSQLNQSSFSHRLQFHFSEQTGHRLNITAILNAQPDKRAIYVCGPVSFIEEVMSQARKLGWPEESLHREYFQGQRSIEMDNAPREAFQVKVASTGQIVDVDPGLSITQALEMNGVDIPISCEEGWCGTCMTRVIEGVPDHRDTFLSNDERNQSRLIMPCCSRSRSDLLVLDI